MPSSKIKKPFYEILESAKNSVAQFPWENKQAYAAWLAQSYYFVRHSTRLLALSAGKLDLSQEFLHQRMTAHFTEENGHEKLALLDLKSLGFDISNFSEFTSTKLFYQSQYYWLLQRSAASIMGYIIFLEGFAAAEGPNILKTVLRHHGQNTVRFLKVHAEEDQNHIKTAFDAIRTLDNSEIDEIIENMRTSAELYTVILEKCLQTVNVDCKEAQL